VEQTEKEDDVRSAVKKRGTTHQRGGRKFLADWKEEAHAAQPYEQTANSAPPKHPPPPLRTFPGGKKSPQS